VAFVGLLDDPRLEAVRPALLQRLDALAGAWDVAAFRDAMVGPARDTLLDAIESVGASEGTLWVVDASGQGLVPAFNSGPSAALFLERVRQPLERGIISMVAATEQPFCENDVVGHATHDGTVDRLVGRRTLALIAVPFYLAGRLRGVVSCVRLGDGDEPAGGAAAAFSPEDLARLGAASDALTIRFEHATLRAVVGWPSA
jgi:hypothetical protein